MRLVLRNIELRGGYADKTAWEPEIVDLDTGKVVGSYYQENKPRLRRVTLFGGKYVGEFATHQECDAFAKGVEAVLNHMTAADEELAEFEAA